LSLSRLLAATIFFIVPACGYDIQGASDRKTGFPPGSVGVSAKGPTSVSGPIILNDGKVAGIAQLYSNRAGEPYFFYEWQPNEEFSRLPMRAMTIYCHPKEKTGAVIAQATTAPRKAVSGKLEDCPIGSTVWLEIK